MKAVKAIGMLACGLILAATPHACGEPHPPVSAAQLDAFMTKWAAYESFKTPMVPEDEPLQPAALEKNPKGPRAAYISMTLAQTIFKDEAGPEPLIVLIVAGVCQKTIYRNNTAKRKDS